MEHPKLFLMPKQIYNEVLPRVCAVKAAMPPSKQFVSAILAGMYIGFGAVFAMTAMAGVDTFGLKKLIGGSVFSVGLMLVVIAGAELFTGNVLMSLTCIMRKIHLGGVLRNWIFVYLGNFIGSVIMAWLIYQSGLMGTPDHLSVVGNVAAKIAVGKTALGFWPAFVRGMLCNILVNLAIIMAISAQTVEGKILGILFPISAFVASGFEHSVANMFFLSLGAYLGKVGWGQMWTSNIIAVTLGNITGPLLFTVIPYYFVYYYWKKK